MKDVSQEWLDDLTTFYHRRRGLYNDDVACSLTAMRFKTTKEKVIKIIKDYDKKNKGQFWPLSSFLTQDC